VADCEDPNCRASAACQEDNDRTCCDHVDNDGDHLVDCKEPECQAFPCCLEGTEESCQDRLDNDDDGATDCQDESCRAWLACFPTSPLHRSAGCEEARPALLLADDFEGDAIDTALWDVFSSSQADRPRLFEGGLDTHGRDGHEQAGIASKARFSVGTLQPFELEFALRQVGPCHVPTCDLSVELHTRLTWVDLARDGRPVLSLHLQGTNQPQELAYACSYRGAPLPPAGRPVFTFDEGSVTRFSVVLDEPTGKLLVFRGGQRLCETPPIRAAEPETRLVFHSTGPSRLGEATRKSRLLVDRVLLDVQAQELSAACEGLRRPILPDGFCVPDVLHDGGLYDPTVLRTEDGTHHLFVHAYHNTSHTDVVHAVSPDGRTGWEWVTVEEPLFAPHDWADWALGALLFHPGNDRFEAWGTHGGSAPQRWATEGADPSAWDLAEPLSVTVDAGGPAVDPESWRPDTVLLAEGGYLAWLSEGWEEEGDAVFVATSEDGLRWTVEPEPVLTRGAPGSWDDAGVWAPSVHHNGDYYLLAYESGRFGCATAIGLAVSRDGRTWLRHRDNPVLQGEDAGFDLHGVGDPSVRHEGGVVRIWYTAQDFQLLRCDNEVPETGHQRRIGLAELRQVP